MPRQLFGGRVSTSTAVIALVFVVTLATYLLVRPVPASVKQGKPSVPVQPLQRRSTAPSPTTRPRPSPTPKPVASTSPTAVETRHPGSASPNAPAPSTSSAVASEKPSGSAEPSR